MLHAQWLGVIWALRALAYACHGQCEEAETAVTTALAKGKRKHIPAWAKLHLYLGQAQLHCGQQNQAMEHFVTARSVDPQGYYGRIAAQALRNMGKITSDSQQIQHH
ncbi:MAG: hypothetical protein GY796_29200 [Chloroflexi bacterium]|nr:hypothetical protein [Chloroflexota bacterium]